MTMQKTFERKGFTLSSLRALAFQLMKSAVGKELTTPSRTEADPQLLCQRDTQHRARDACTVLFMKLTKAPETAVLYIMSLHCLPPLDV